MIHLIVGNTGSGKTTYAKQLKNDTGGLIFSIDQWNKTLFLPDKKPTVGLEWFLERIERAESLIQSLIAQLESEKTDSILDLGLSKFDHREKFRKFAKTHGFDLKLHYLDVAKEVRLERVIKRNREKGETFEFEVTRQNFDFMESWFEIPTTDELEGGIIAKK